MFREDRKVRLSEASQAIGVARSTAHRLMAMLQYHGFVSRDPRSRAYVAGPALVDVGLSVVRNMDIRRQARPYLEQLCAQTGETVHLVTLQEGNVLFLDSVEAQEPLRVASRVGMQLSAHCTSVGKALLAELPPEELRRLYKTRKMAALTPDSVTDRSVLEAELVEVRRRGYAVNHGESEEGVCSVGVGVRDQGGQIRAGLSVAAPRGRFDAKGPAMLARALLEVAQELGASLP